MDYKLINTYDELLHNVKQNSQSNTIIFALPIEVLRAFDGNKMTDIVKNLNK